MVIYGLFSLWLVVVNPDTDAYNRKVGPLTKGLGLSKKLLASHRDARFCQRHVPLLERPWPLLERP